MGEPPGLAGSWQRALQKQAKQTSADSHKMLREGRGWSLADMAQCRLRSSLFSQPPWFSCCRARSPRSFCASGCCGPLPNRPFIFEGALSTQLLLQWRTVPVSLVRTPITRVTLQPKLAPLHGGRLRGDRRFSGVGYWHHASSLPSLLSLSLCSLLQLRPLNCPPCLHQIL